MKHGVCIPLASIHSQKSSGIGEIPDLIPFLDFLSALGMNILQLLPLNDTGDDPSPYNALSSCALAPIYLGLSSLPYRKNQTILDELKRFNNTETIEWEKVRLLKEVFLKEYLKTHRNKFISLPSFEKFQKNNPWLEEYGRFISPEQEIIQFLLFEQFKEVKSYAEKKEIKILGDIPILVSESSQDVQANPQLFDLTLRAGAPPDMYNDEGQNWNFPIYNWKEIEKENFSLWRTKLETAEQLYHLYRLDHIVGFFRIFAIPEGKSPTEGSFIPPQKSNWIRQGTHLLKKLQTFSSMTPIGEDLGVIPPEVRDVMKDLKIPGTKVMRWERYWETTKAFIPIDEYDPLSLTCVSTHDAEPLALWWSKGEKDVLLFCKQMGWSWNKKMQKSQLYEILRMSHASSSLYHVNLLNEYLALFPELIHDTPEKERINTPGTTLHSNWRYRFIPSVEELLHHKELTTALKELIPQKDDHRKKSRSL